MTERGRYLVMGWVSLGLGLCTFIVSLKDMNQSVFERVPDQDLHNAFDLKSEATESGFKNYVAALFLVGAVASFRSARRSRN